MLQFYLMDIIRMYSNTIGRIWNDIRDRWPRLNAFISGRVGRAGDWNCSVRSSTDAKVGRGEEGRGTGRWSHDSWVEHLPPSERTRKCVHHLERLADVRRRWRTYGPANAFLDDA